MVGWGKETKHGYHPLGADRLGGDRGKQAVVIPEFILLLVTFQSADEICGMPSYLDNIFDGDMGNCFSLFVPGTIMSMFT